MVLLSLCYVYYMVPCDYLQGNNWDEFIHLLCCSLEMAFGRMLSCSSQNNKFDSPDVDLVLQNGLRSCDRSTVAGIVGALRVICKHLKEDYDDGVVKVYYDSVNSCLLKMPWNLFDECWSFDIGSMSKSLSVNELHLNSVGVMDPGIRFLGTFLQLICTLVDRNNFVETGCDTAKKHPLFVTVINLIPRLVKWCLPKQEDSAETCIIHYMKHKLLVWFFHLFKNLRTAFFITCRIECKFPHYVLWKKVMISIKMPFVILWYTKNKK